MRKHVYIPEDLVQEVERRGASLSKMVAQGLRVVLGFDVGASGSMTVPDIERVARRVVRSELGIPADPPKALATKPKVEPIDEGPKYDADVPAFVKPDEIFICEDGLFKAQHVLGALQISLADLMEDFDAEDLLTSPQHGAAIFLNHTGIYTALAVAERLGKDTTEFQTWLDKQV